MTRTRREALSVGLACIGSIALAGCLGDDASQTPTPTATPTPAGDADEAGVFDRLGIGEFQLLDRAHDPHEELAYMHGDHWHGAGAFPTVPLGDAVSIGAYVEDEDGHELELGREFELQAALAENASEIVSFDAHGDHVHVIGEETGVTEIVFQLRGTAAIEYQTAPLAVQVVEDGDEHDHTHAFDAHHVESVRVLDREPDPHEVVAEWHEGQWHGGLPDVPVGETVSLGLVFVDEDGAEADLGHEYEARVRHAADAEALLEFAFHGDHVHLIGTAAGTTEVVFQLWHDDHADHETDTIAVSVVDADDT